MLRVFRHYVSSRKLTFFLAESGIIATAGALGGALLATVRAAPSGQTEQPAFAAELGLIAAGVGVALAVVLQLALYAFDLYDLRVATEDRGRGIRALKALGLAAIVAGLWAWVSRVLLPPGLLLGAAVGSVLGAVMCRFSLRQLVGRADRVLMVGGGRSGREVIELLDQEGEGFFRVVSLVDPSTVDLVSKPRSLAELARSLDARHVVLSLEDARGKVPGEALFYCRVAGLRVYSAAVFCERVLRRLPVRQLRVSELAFSDDLTSSAGRRGLKRAFDLFAATLLLLCASPVMLLITLLVKLDSKGPVFYRQERVGADGRSYWLWKFRSMRTDAEKDGAVWARTNDDRVTRVGRFIRKTRIDEIPQVFNVLAGDMSFVGPRPERPVFVEKLKREVPHYGLREAVKPGITGWAQIRYPYGASVEDARNKLEYDLYYVKNGSLFLDMAIMFHTVRHVLFGKGAR